MPQHNNQSVGGARLLICALTIIGSAPWQNEKEKDMPSFPSLSFDDVTTTTAPDAALSDNDEAQAKDSFEEEAPDGTAGADTLFETLAAADGGGGFSSSHHSTLNKLLSKP